MIATGRTKPDPHNLGGCDVRMGVARSWIQPKLLAKSLLQVAMIRKSLRNGGDEASQSLLKIVSRKMR